MLAPVSASTNSWSSMALHAVQTSHSLLLLDLYIVLILIYVTGCMQPRYSDCRTGQSNPSSRVPTKLLRGARIVELHWLRAVFAVSAWATSHSLPSQQRSIPEERVHKSGRDLLWEPALQCTEISYDNWVPQRRFTIERSESDFDDTFWDGVACECDRAEYPCWDEHVVRCSRWSRSLYGSWKSGCAWHR